MVVYYAKKHSLLHMLKLQASSYVAMDVQAASIAFLNDHTVYGMDQILDATWSTHRTVTMRLATRDGQVTKQKFLFDCQADLFFFLVELGMEPSQFGGTVQRGSFKRRSICNPIAEKGFRKSYTSRTPTRCSRKSAAKSDFY
ncbi:hypothetical protein H310_09501 [Aphanomyces invadans]|uniref:Uncharacterized protein n=1 Tax=Aphanomyces invadans TaxID=157072 RepID=A0A024TTV2_9STRA|nr:hypothetical protein H310_09501 [Aphanomyces invadans]ETV97605.1 hypothetical protein H310_09501 [Aphanomyces invadans]|eukprot:XP_008873814.1 hypothetical protein H310_09501 [Aphanomyces invadans]